MAVSRRLFVARQPPHLVALTGTRHRPRCPRTAAPPARPPALPHPRRCPTTPREDLVRKASQVRPTARQIAWQRLERTAFLHFGVNTFTGLEWGTGDEDPDVFQPAGLDTDQWARALRDGGFSSPSSPSSTTTASSSTPPATPATASASSSWRDGRGDVLRSFADSMRRHGIKVGVYVSPADENQYLHGVYANGSARADHTIPTLVDGDDRAGTDLRTFTLPATDYGAHMLNQLYEVLTEYGPVDEVWFDGAQGRIPPDKVEKLRLGQLVHARSAPSRRTPSIAVSGPDVRWVGNEGGLAREDEWSVVPVKEKDYGRTDYALPYEAADRAAGTRCSRRSRSPTTCSGGPPSAMCRSGPAGSTTPTNSPRRSSS